MEFEQYKTDRELITKEVHIFTIMLIYSREIGFEIDFER